MSKRLKVGVLFGGKSGEHEVSIQSAKSVMGSLDSSKYEVVPIHISKGGHWTVDDSDASTAVAPRVAGHSVPTDFGQGLDVIVPVLHGSNGEDGTIQGLLEVLDLPYVGAGVLASAVGMDKVFMKTVFAAAGLPQVRYTHFTRRQWENEPEEILERVEAEIRYPCFVKPANLGSSVGISKAKDRAQLQEAIHLATRFDRKVIVEEGLQVREIEVAVLGNDEPLASVPGEIVPSSEFYDYRAKYVDGESALFIPADLSLDQANEIRKLAVEAFLSLECTGLARVDFFIDTATNRILVNEINTMPGFTVYSMYPKLWEATGLPYSELIDRLIDLALQRHSDKGKNVTDYTSL